MSPNRVAVERRETLFLIDFFAAANFGRAPWLGFRSSIVRTPLRMTYLCTISVRNFAGRSICRTNSPSPRWMSLEYRSGRYPSVWSSQLEAGFQPNVGSPNNRPICNTHSPSRIGNCANSETADVDEDAEIEWRTPIVNQVSNSSVNLFGRRAFLDFQVHLR